MQVLSREAGAEAERPTRLDILLDDYRETRRAAVQLTHSFFVDVPVMVALVGAIPTGSLIAEVPSILLALPTILGSLILYLIMKLRGRNLATSYLAYLEQEINKECQALALCSS